MGMRSEIIASNSDKIKEEWEKKLQEAYDQKDWDMVKQLIDKMASFSFY